MKRSSLCTQRQLLSLGAVLGCSLGAVPPDETPTPQVVPGAYLLVGVDGNRLPAAVSFCNPSCEGSKIVFADTLKIERDDSTFAWNISFANTPVGPVERATLTGSTLIGQSGSAQLTATNNPALPPGVPTGILTARSDSSFDFYAFPPWRSRNAARFQFRRAG